jgi:hypothetical protein
LIYFGKVYIWTKSDKLKKTSLVTLREEERTKETDQWKDRQKEKSKDKHKEKSKYKHKEKFKDKQKEKWKDKQKEKGKENQTLKIILDRKRRKIKLCI